MAGRNLIFHPLAVLLISIVAALSYALWVSWRFPGGDLSSHYVYVVPAVVPFVAFVMDRVRRIHHTSIGALAIDGLILGMSVLRMFGMIPLISGHALFFGLCGASSWLMGHAHQRSVGAGADGLPEVPCLA